MGGASDRLKGKLPGRSRRGSPKRLRVYRSWCKRCGICVALCPKSALDADQEGYPVWGEESACNGCRMCELRCPDFAIEVVMEEGPEDEQGH